MYCDELITRHNMISERYPYKFWSVPRCELSRLNNRLQRNEPLVVRLTNQAPVVLSSLGVYLLPLDTIFVAYGAATMGLDVVSFARTGNLYLVNASKPTLNITALIPLNCLNLKSKPSNARSEASMPKSSSSFASMFISGVPRQMIR